MFDTEVAGSDIPSVMYWLGAGSLAVQAALLTGLIVLPLLHPARMPEFTGSSIPMRLAKPKIPLPKPKPTPTARAVTLQPSPMPTAAPAGRPAVIARPAIAPDNELPVLLASGTSMSDSNPLLSGVGPNAGSGTVATSVTPNRVNGGKQATVRLSQGVTNGMLLEPIRPEYPAIARATRTEGTVVLTATIDSTGRIEGIRILSGPPMLRKAAQDAVRQARYTPYRLNGTPTEVETTISITFRVGGL